MENAVLSVLVQHLSAWKGLILYATIATAAWSSIARVIGDRFLFTLAMLLGTFLHELLHFLVGAIMNARPSSFSVIPNRTKLGSVAFTNITWYNAIPVALALLLGLVFVSAAAIHGLPASIHNITAANLLVLLVLSPVAYACWPSSVDWKLSLRGWPLYVGGMAYLVHVVV